MLADNTAAAIDAARLAVRPPRASHRRPFTPSATAGPYRLPHDVRDRLATALAPLRNREAAFALAAFLARFWSSPARITLGFPIDRRALAGHVDLDLSEARVRGAIAALEAAGFLERVMPATRSRHRLTEAGELHRKPVIYRFGPDYLSLFLKANRRAEKARGARSRREPPRHLAPARPPVGFPESATAKSLAKSLTNSPKNKSEVEPKVLMGEIRGQNRTPPPPASDPRLEAALERWKMALRREPAAPSGKA
jgi:hypothetical protein